MKQTNFSFEIRGGVGKHIAFTSFIKWFNEKYPESKINIISAYPEIFEYNPRIHRNLRMGQPYLFEDYIKNTDYRNGEIYNMYEYYREKDKISMYELLPKAYGFDEYNTNPESEIYLTKGEEMDGKVYAEQNKPLITFQPFGGLPPEVQPNRMKMDSSQRDMPMLLAIKIVNILNKAGFKVLQIRGPNEMPINGTMQLNLPFRNILPIAKYSLGHVGIDSSMMHASAVFKKPQLIFWGQTHKDNLAYKYDGFINAFNKYGMHCRPHLQLPDNEAMFPYKDKNEGREFEYTDEELEKYLADFINSIKNHKYINK